MTGPGRPLPELNAVFERMLDRALRLEQVAEAIGGGVGPLGCEELRDRALRARAAIVAFADIEYRAYLEALAAAREGGPPATGPPDAAAKPSVLPVLLWRVPAVTGLVLLLSGFAARCYGGRPHAGVGLVAAGLLVAAIAVGAAVGDAVRVSVAAARGRTEAERDTPPDATGARQTWELALLERGMVPFLLGRIEEERMAQRGERVAR
ncbi:hypothetical protein ACFXDH_09080 [Streptomyces sp. NPDC059467]|uniref:hypothetical protein n=1 Tax=Streptomyces sp. NPDC059467 TaxID=3346844 RepID=UPI0036C36247